MTLKKLLLYGRQWLAERPLSGTSEELTDMDRTESSMGVGGGLDFPIHHHEISVVGAFSCGCVVFGRGCLVKFCKYFHPTASRSVQGANTGEVTLC